jgi:3-deoxy-D-manno-octulosonic-acid transferase
VVTRTLSLQAYLTFANARSMVAGQAAHPRPNDRPPLIWLHADRPETGRALACLGCRLKLLRPELTLLGTGAVPDTAELRSLRLPQENGPDVDSFLQEHAPSACLWAGAELRPALLAATRATGSLMVALQTDERLWHSPAPRWLPDPSQATLALFDQIHLTSEPLKRDLRRHGIPSERLRPGGPLIDTALPDPTSENLQTEVMTSLAGRPVWLAARISGPEAGDVLRAHRRAIRLAHRLLLVIVPNQPDDHARILRSAEAEQMRICHWDDGEMPDENTQVLLTETPDELPLWYQIAPLSFLGGSLVSGRGGIDPYEAAAQGTAILYGPNVGRHLPAYGRLVDAGAARIVRDSDSLAGAVQTLIAPDLSASMALAGWDVISSGAELVDRLIATVIDRLDADESRSARFAPPPPQETP